MKPIKGFENYVISDCGVITNTKTGRVLKQNKNQKGYCQVQLSNNGYSKTISIHREVFKNYNGVIKHGLEINHIDGNKENNCSSNLEQVTKKENMLKAVELGLVKVGKECNLSVPVQKIDVITGEVLEEFGSINIASKKTGVAGSAISMVCNNKRVTAGGFKWKKII